MESVRRVHRLTSKSDLILFLDLGFPTKAPRRYQVEADANRRESGEADIEIGSDWRTKEN